MISRGEVLWGHMWAVAWYLTTSSVKKIEKMTSSKTIRNTRGKHFQERCPWVHQEENSVWCKLDHFIITYVKDYITSADMSFIGYPWINARCGSRETWDTSLAVADVASRGHPCKPIGVFTHIWVLVTLRSFKTPLVGPQLTFSGFPRSI